MLTQFLNKHKWQLLAALGIFSLLLALVSCGGQATPSLQEQVDAAVVATLSSIPSPAILPTATSRPIPTSAPTSTQVSSAGLFFEYHFCIGHPTDMVLVDDGLRHNPPALGSQTNGILFGYTNSLFMQVNWQISDPNFNPQTAMKLILEESQTLQGNLDVLLIGTMNVYYQPTTTITPKLPYGGVAVWQCGGRDFMWKVYTPQDGMALGLLKQSLARFRCD